MKTNRVRSREMIYEYLDSLSDRLKEIEKHDDPTPASSLSISEKKSILKPPHCLSVRNPSTDTHCNPFSIMTEALQASILAAAEPSLERVARAYRPRITRKMRVRLSGSTASSRTLVDPYFTHAMHPFLATRQVGFLGLFREPWETRE